jgi:hypothetical protein
MQKQTLTPTMLVGVGGTGVAVLRKFKRLYMEVNDEADQYIKLLAIDTDNQLEDNQLEGTDPYLDNSEFLQLAKPDPIQVTDVLRESRRGTKSLEWLSHMNLPAFEMHRGAGMKRLQGHMAYFWKGVKIRKRIEEVMAPLLEANPNLKGQERATGVRLFIVSSLCGGTGTGMFLDMAYLVRDVIEAGGGPRVKTFGLLFLPSAFQQLRTKPAWPAIHANGYAALQELNYYMDTPFRDTKLYVPGGTRPQIELDAAPFQYCFLVGGVNDRGDHVRHSEDLYERTAEFLFVNVTTPIGDRLVSHEVENRSIEQYRGSKAFAAFGSFSMALPQARNIQKYLLLMGRELLDDVLVEEPKRVRSRSVEELFGSIGEFVEASNIGDGSGDLPFAVGFANSILSRHPKQASSLDNADAVMTTESQELGAATAEFDQQLIGRAQNLHQAILGQVDSELRANWNLTPGTAATAKVFADSVLGSMQSLFERLENAKASSWDSFDTVLARHRTKGFMGLGIGKPAARRIPDFEYELTQAFSKRAAARLAEEYQKAVSSVRDDLTSLQRSFEQLRNRADEYKGHFREEALKLLHQVAKEESRAFLADPHIEDETSDYANERLALWNHCQAQQQLTILLRSPRDGRLDTASFARELFKVIRAYITEQSSTAAFTDIDRLNSGLQDAKINLKLGPGAAYHSPETTSLLFIDGNKNVEKQLCDAIQKAPGDFGRPQQTYPSLDQGSMTYVRIMSSFALEDLADAEFMADCYQQRKRLPAEGVYLDLPTHRRADILSLGGEDEGPRMFGLARALSRIEEVGQNFLFDDERLLQADEPDPVERRQHAYAALLRSDLKSRVLEIIEKRTRNLGGNEQFVPDMEQKLGERYPQELLEGTDPICAFLRKERAAADAYLKSLGVVRTASARNDE